MYYSAEKPLIGLKVELLNRWMVHGAISFARRSRGLAQIFFLRTSAESAWDRLFELLNIILWWFVAVFYPLWSLSKGDFWLGHFAAYGGLFPNSFFFFPISFLRATTKWPLWGGILRLILPHRRKKSASYSLFWAQLPGKETFMKVWVNPWKSRFENSRHRLKIFLWNPETLYFPLRA